MNNETIIFSTNGSYEHEITTKGTYTIITSKPGYRNQAQSIDVSDLTVTYTLNFLGTDGLVPNAPDLSYVLSCINKWKFPPDDGTGLTISKVLSVINAWKYPVTTDINDDEKAVYLAGIMPIIDRHNDTRNTLMEAEETFTFAYPSLDNVEIYCGALTTAKTLLNAEYEDAYAVTPPGALSEFHYKLYTAIYEYKQYVTQHLTYYEGVYQEGTSDLAYYEKGEEYRASANDVWWNYIMPEIENLVTH